MKKANAEVHLSAPLKYHTDKGQESETTLLVIYPPKPTQDKVRSKLKSMFLRTARAFAQSQSNDELEKKELRDEDIDNRENAEKQMQENPDEIITFLYAADEDVLDIEEFKKTFQELLFDGCCKIDNEVNLKGSYFDEIDSDDRDLLYGEYLVNFFLPSWT